MEVMNNFILMQHIIFFDGVCNFCNYWVNFIIKKDNKKHFMFAPLQGKTAAKFLGQNEVRRTDTLILLQDNKLYYRSSAVLRIARQLKGGWKLFYGLIILPPFFRDPVYNFIAKNRYKWFGRKQNCMVPDAELKHRFLG
jgi:predicted DCC family thiol-disulfide oxidoreductase YuxK